MRNPDRYYWEPCDKVISTHRERGWKNDSFKLRIDYNWFAPGTNIVNRPTAHLYINVHHKDDVFLCEPLIGVNDTFIPVPMKSFTEVKKYIVWINIIAVERDGHIYIRHIKDGESYLQSAFDSIKMCARDTIRFTSNPSIKDFDEFCGKVYETDDLNRMIRDIDVNKKKYLNKISNTREKIVATQARIERKCERCANSLNELETEFGIKVNLDDPSLRHHIERCELAKKYWKTLRDNCPMYQFDVDIERIWSLFFDIHTAVIDALDEKGNDVIQLNSFQNSINEIQHHISEFEDDVRKSYKSLEELSKWFEQFGCFAKV